MRDRRLLLASFHPELTDDPRVHELFLEMVREAPHASLTRRWRASRGGTPRRAKSSGARRRSRAPPGGGRPLRGVREEEARVRA